ncbi:lipid-A-disaccharide synthase [Falsiroseomonas tokyonensis]|uniref:Lipid-A-disaccharide synthase n=1 Tax=Falsiroseomonas tokyonensis TaxID=430521 RepID=A0ABV7BVL7_9PROT|nr:lipid-A-disaccharide synthase [Falsiroseomonas tokyonensis]MBU8538039.1 lipid-A-disaccharide synthase [Falsiroseomonas tokyonensis]
MSLVYLVAGEASGDVLGARLLAALRARDPSLAFAGVGGDRLAEQGLPSLFPMRELALMGLIEVLPNIRRLARRLDETVADIAARRPAVVVTIDSPGFTLRLAQRIRPLGIPVVHYVAPQIWAWRPGRIAKIKAAVDHILCLLPFEPVIFEAAGIPASFVGHPVLESGVDAGDAARFRAAHGLAAEAPVLVVMPGSRRMEVKRLLPIFGQALRLLAPRVPNLTVALPVSAVVAEAVQAGVRDWPGRTLLVTDLAGKHDAFAAAREHGAGLIKSGTSSLEMAVAGVPHLVAYKVNPITAAIVRRLVRVPFASLVNLLADRRVVPEYLQEAATPQALAEGLAGLLLDAAPAAAQRAGFAEMLLKLRPQEGLPSAAAAAVVLNRIEDHA